MATIVKESGVVMIFTVNRKIILVIAFIRLEDISEPTSRRRRGSSSSITRDSQSRDRRCNSEDNSGQRYKVVHGGKG